jgi:uncharacterized membrane protein YbhN (UPF0104 family)
MSDFLSYIGRQPLRRIVIGWVCTCLSVFAVVLAVTLMIVEAA